MRAPANPLASRLERLALTFVALMLMTTLAGAPAVADEPADAEGGPLAAQLSKELPLAAAVGDGDAVPGDSDGAEADLGTPSTLAGYLTGGMLRVSADVVLAEDGDEVEPIVGSFTVDGLT